MLSKKVTTEISLHCYAAVGGLMATMSNPKCRGENFTWEKFPDIASNYCEVQVLLSVIVPDKNREKARRLAKETGHSIAVNWVRQMTE